MSSKQTKCVVSNQFKHHLLRKFICSIRETGNLLGVPEAKHYSRDVQYIDSIMGSAFCNMFSI